MGCPKNHSGSIIIGMKVIRVLLLLMRYNFAGIQEEVVMVASFLFFSSGYTFQGGGFFNIYAFIV